MLLKVSKSEPCIICGKRDWCGRSEDGAIAICMRESSGSDRMSSNGGYVHILKPGHSAARVYDVPLPVATADLNAMAAQFRATADQLGTTATLASDLGVGADSLEDLWCGYDLCHRCWTFPMTGADNHVTGIVRRYLDGRKLLYPNHHPSLYMPNSTFHTLPVMAEFKKWLLVCEGASDVCIANDLGFTALGRFSCSHIAVELLRLVKEFHVPRVAIITDQGNFSERHGSLKLAETIKTETGAELTIVWPPPMRKDLRCWRPSKEELQTAIENGEIV